MLLSAAALPAVAVAVLAAAGLPAAFAGTAPPAAGRVNVLHLVADDMRSVAARTPRLGLLTGIPMRTLTAGSNLAAAAGHRQNTPRLGRLVSVRTLTAGLTRQ